MKIIIAPDKFKGSLSSFEVCHAIKAGIKEITGSFDIHSFPMADGGDGFAEVLKYYNKTETVFCETVDPLHRKITVSYQWNEADKTAIIEMAAASGLVLLKEEDRNPLLTSTYGTGILIKDAIGKGAGKIIIGLGGSATNDAGMGILAAMGFRFENGEGIRLDGNGKNLLRIRKIIPPPAVPAVQFEIACDVQNVLFGEQGAAFVYAPQKGANEAMIIELDEGLRNFAAVIKEQLHKDVAFIPGTGAAGGIAAGLIGFFEVEMKRGIDMVLNSSGISKQLATADLLITGEGKIDSQTTQGKVVGRLAVLAAELGVRCIAFCGIQQVDGLPAGIQKIIALAENEEQVDYAMLHAASLLQRKTAGLFNTDSW